MTTYRPKMTGPNSHLKTFLVGVLLMVLAQWTMASTSTRCKGSIRIPMPKDAKAGRPIKLDYCYGIATVFELDICRMMNCGMYADPFYKAEKNLCIATDIMDTPATPAPANSGSRRRGSRILDTRRDTILRKLRGRKSRRRYPCARRSTVRT